MRKSAGKSAKKSAPKTVKKTVKKPVRESAGKRKGTRLGRFIADLATNPDKLRAYKSDPEAAMKAGGLSDDDKAVLYTGDFRSICDYLGGPTPGPHIATNIRGK